MLTLFMAVFCFQSGTGDAVQELIHNNPFNWERIDNRSQAIMALSEGEFHSSQFLEAVNEEEASLAVRQLIATTAARSGVTINSINMRKARPLNEDGSIRELRTYFGYDANLESLATMFDLVENSGFPVKIQNLTISSRRSPRRSKSGEPRPPLNGNAIISVTYSDTDQTQTETHTRGDVFLTLISALANALPEGSMLTHIQIKDGNLLTIQGETLDLDSVHEALLDMAVIKDVRPGNILAAQGVRGQFRFFFKAVLTGIDKVN